MITKSNVIEQFLNELSRTSGEDEEASFGTVEELRRFAIREGFYSEEKENTKD